MRSVSNAFKQALEDGNRNYQCNVYITLADNTQVTLTNANLLINGLSINDSISSDSDFTALGSVIVNAVEIRANNLSGTYSEYDFIDGIATVHIGLTIGTTIESIKIGTYVINDASFKKSVLSLYCLDYLSKFDKPYSNSVLVYPATLATILSGACTDCGVTLYSTVFPNSTLSIPTAPQGDLTYREVISYIATIAGCFVKCNANGQLVLQWFDFNAEHSLSALASYDYSTTDITITGIKIITQTTAEAETTEVEHLFGEDGYIITIENNPFITETNVTTIGDYLESQIVGLTFRVGTTLHLSDPTIEAGDTAVVIDRHSNTYNILVTNTTFNVSSYQETKCSAQEPTTKTAVRFTETQKTYTATKQLIQQEKSARQQLGQELSSAINAKAGMYETRVQESGGGYTYYLHDKPLLANSTAVIKVTNEAVGVTPDYQASPPTWYGLTVNGNYVANIMSTIGIDFDWGTGGTLTLGGADNTNGLLVIKDASNNTIGQWNNNGINTIKGIIGGWSINDYQISSYDVESTSTQYGVFIRSKESNGPATSNTYHFCVYHRPYENGAYGDWVIDFGVKHDGTLVATKGSISGSLVTGTLTSVAINNGSGTFSVTSAGALTATSATITGAITTTSGTIGGFTASSTANTGTTASGGHVYSNSLYTHSSDTDYEYEAGIAGGGAYNNAAFYIKRMTKNAQWSSSDHVFYVRNDGYLYSTRGAMAGWNIGEYQISSTSSVTSGVTNQTQYTVFIRSKNSDLSNPTKTTKAFGVSSRTYNGSTYGSWSDKWYVDYEGNMTASAGTLGPWTLDTDCIKRGGGYNSATANSMYFGNSGLSIMDKFFVDSTGKAWVTDELHVVGSGKISFDNTLTGSTYGTIRYSGYGISVSAAQSLTLGTTNGSTTIIGENVVVQNVLGEDIFYCDMTGLGLETINLMKNTSITGNTTITGTLQTSANINIVSTNTAAYAVGVQNAAKKVQLYIASNGNMGVYNATDSHYVVYEDADNVIRMPQVYAKTNPGVANVYIDSYGRMYKSTAGSSRRYKHDIEALTDYKKILDIPVVSFIYNDDHLAINDRRRGLKCPGLIAEDVDRYYSIATEKQDGPIEDWNIRYIVPPMLAVEQDHEKRINELETEINELKQIIKKLVDMQ